ncbi:MAG: rhomboid family intramembrane serine protease [Verrucomicrobiae bacterium]|nr:rhomboid family intramembrane serine protease [Verrucomicrobiae bacterium]
MIPLRDDNPTRTFPGVTILLIAVNVLVFFYQSALPEARLEHFLASFTMVPAEVTGSAPGAYRSIFTSMFLHANLMHLLGNMLFLWIFGNNVEDILGHLPYLLFYLLCGIGADFAHILSSAHSQIPTLGASGAISGVLGAYILLFPRAQVLTFLFYRLIYVPAWVFLGVWFIGQVLAGGMGGGESGGVAVWAHVGGFIVGAVLLPFFKLLSRGRGRGELTEAPTYERTV